MMGAYNFAVLDTTPGTPGCLLVALPGEDQQAYQERLRALWQRDPMVRQHIVLYARRHMRGQLRYAGPLAQVAQLVIEQAARWAYNKT